MTAPTLNTAVIPETTSPGSPPNTDTAAPRPGSRADRMARPLSRDVLKALAEANGVCVRPIAIRRIDKHTGESHILDIPCGARLASKCAPCALRNKRLRQQQIREGWHLTEEPAVPIEAPSEEAKAAVALRCEFVLSREEAARAEDWAQVEELDQAIAEVDEHLATLRVRGSLPRPAEDHKPRRARSTRRRQDATDLPKLKVENRTVGKIYVDKAGHKHRPSMFLTITLGSHGPVHGGVKVRRNRLEPCECGKLHGHDDPLLGAPIDPGTYNYRQAALDAVFFAATLDRFWQNLRRAAGLKLQYAGTIELQKRLAPHAHFAMRGTLPKQLIRQVAAATYHQVWWPKFEEPVYSSGKLPVWDDETESYLDPKTKAPLKTWEQALDELEANDAEPAYVARLGSVKPDGIEPGTKNAERTIKYATKYVTKDLTEHAAPKSDEQLDHFNRLHEELSTIPCSPTCANWLLYGIQPKDAKKGLKPGRCSGKVHQRATLGFTGRRVLVSRQWSGKTLTDHRHDQKAWIRTVLNGATEAEDPSEPDRYVYELAKPGEPGVPSVQLRIMHAIATRQRWKAQLRQALAPPGDVSATVIST